MTLIPYRTPWSVLGSLQRELGQLQRLSDGCCDGGNWIPSVDVREEKDKFCISADLPGVDPKDVEVTVEGNCMTLQGSRSERSASDEDGYRRVERVQGSFYRQFNLPESADPDNVKAESRNGVLHITVPKQEKELPRRVKVSS